MPTLVITGEQDFITGPVCARSSPRASRRPRRWCCRASGHMIFVEAPEQFREAVLSFLGVGARA